MREGQKRTMLLTADKGLIRVQSITANKDDKLICPKPFEFITVDSNGNSWLCCEDWLPTSIGNLLDKSIYDIWNSKIAQEIRTSILDGSFRYCDNTRCPALIQKTLKPTSRITDPFLRYIIKTKTIRLKKGPKTLSLGYDNSCNLKCPSCRAEIFSINGEKYRQAEQLQAKILREALLGANEVIITGYGEPFASCLYMKLLQNMNSKDYPALRIILMTNGLLFTPKMWKMLKKIQESISGVSVSIDAATPETYAVTRGGNFKELLRNLNFISGLVKEGKLSWFEISFVVQAYNFHEMKLFVQMGKRLGCDSVLFQKIIHWSGTYLESEFQKIAVHEPDHPCHAKFLEVLSDGIFNDPVVDLSNLENLKGKPYRAAL